MVIDLGSSPRLPRCFYCGSILLPEQIKCDACNAPVRQMIRQPVVINYNQTTIQTGMTAEEFECNVLLDTQRAIGLAFLPVMRRCVDRLYTVMKR